VKKYQIINVLGGWLAFLVAAVTYLLTIEPTVSFWDCGEFITTAYKLEVGHPPGAPLFMIVARFFSLFAFGDVTQVAKMVNVMSALASAFTILFLFWSITHLAKKIVVSENETPTTAQLVAIFGSGLVGALAYTFSDTFWFSAVEGEVYASSSLFTAVVFWAILKWENVAHEAYANRWIILIAYLMGLSIGVHLLNLLAIPAIVFVYYFKKYKITKKGIMFAAIISVTIVAAVMYGVIHGVVLIASWFELLFVNGFSLPIHSGFWFYIVLLFGGTIFGIYYTYTHKKAVLNTVLTAFAVIMIGYSSFAMIVIRSLANPPMDENNPENTFALLSYLNREQYGDRPLLFGPYYNAPIEDQKDGKNYYAEINGRYEVIDVKPIYIYNDQFTTFFPRMHSSQESHERGYESWVNIEGTKIKVYNQYSGQEEMLVKPSFADNIAFFFKYQVGHMYLRYFMWNFAGRQNDEQSHGSFSKGNWISGFTPFDELRTASIEKLPDSLANNKARNKYYMLPFLLGMLGLFFQLKKQNRDFWVVMLLFFFTGIAIVMYLNQTPYQPRERDYAYAGSFYAFTIWIGLGVLTLFETMRKFSPMAAAGIATALSLVLVPGIMAAQNWDDHDRSGRYTARDFAMNYLNSCAPNSILFTYGDNDTFPLWYVQEVEGFRTDVRVVNLSLLGTDWYIDQMRKKAYDSEPVKFSISQDDYRQGSLDIIRIIDRVDDFVGLNELLAFAASDDTETKTIPGYGEKIEYLPSRNFILPIDSAKVVENGTVYISDTARILKEIRWSTPRNYFTKSDLAVLDIIVSNNWERPIYFATSSTNENFMGLENYFRLEGFAYRLMPYKANIEENVFGEVDAKVMYDNMMEKFTWGRMNEDDIYVDQQNIRTTLVMSFRESFTRLAEALIQQNEKEKAIEVLDKCVELMPHDKYPFDHYVAQIVSGYYQAGATDKAVAFTKVVAEVMYSELDYYLSLPPAYQAASDYEIRVGMVVFQQMLQLAEAFKQTDLVTELEDDFTVVYMKYMESSGS